MTKNRIEFGKSGTFSGMNLDTITMRMALIRSDCIVSGEDIDISLSTKEYEWHNPFNSFEVGE